MAGWLGMRGVGSPYYLMYAIGQGLAQKLALELIQLTPIAVALAILVRVTGVKPLMGLFWRHRRHLPTAQALAQSAGS